MNYIFLLLSFFIASTASAVSVNMESAKFVELKLDMITPASVNQELFDLVEGLRSKSPNAGMAVGIVDSSGLQAFSSHGFADWDSKSQITEDTLFMIGSTTKAFTSMAAAALVDDGVLDWDQSVVSLIPEFKLSDSSVTDQVTLRDMLLHRTGIPRYDLYWLSKMGNLQEMFEFMTKMKFAAPFRDRMIYNNYMYAAAGEMAARAGNTTWENLVKTKILDRLRMERTRFHVAEVANMTDVAQPHTPAGPNTFQKIPMREIGPHAPAGSMHSSIKEMSHWVRTLLDNGYISRSERLVSQTSFDEVMRPQILFQKGGSVISDSHYSFAWIHYNLFGQKVIEHGGGIDGFITHVAFMPNHDFGVIVLTNGGTLSASNVAKTIIDHYVTKQGHDFFPVRTPPTPVPQNYLADAEEILGTYVNSTWGQVRVTQEKLPNFALVSLHLNNFEPIKTRIHRSDSGQIVLSDFPKPYDMQFVKNESGAYDFFGNFEPMVSVDKYTKVEESELDNVIAPFLAENFLPNATSLNRFMDQAADPANMSVDYKAQIEQQLRVLLSH